MQVHMNVRNSCNPASISLHNQRVFFITHPQAAWLHQGSVHRQSFRTSLAPDRGGCPSRTHLYFCCMRISAPLRLYRSL
jgi:hypothetical protein